MSAPGWTRLLLRIVSQKDRTDEVIGDLDEAHYRRLQQLPAWRATLATSLEALDMARAILWLRLSAPSVSWLDFKLGMRMLVRYPGLTLIAVPAIAFAVMAAAGTYEFVRQVAAPSIPLAEGDRLVGVLNRDVRTVDSYAPQPERLRTVARIDGGVGRDRGVPTRTAQPRDE